MSDDADLDRFVKDPSLLVDLCREVIDRIDGSAEDSNVAEREAQLRAIAKAVEQLEKSGVTVPILLRGEKTRLAASLAMHMDSKQALAQLADEFQEIQKDLRDRLGQDPALTPTVSERKPRGTRSKLSKTSKKVLRAHIVRALKHLGGKARLSEVIEEMGRQLQGDLLPGDMLRRESTNDYAWQNNAKWERFQMTQDGTLRRDSPRGIWELEEGQE